MVRLCRYVCIESGLVMSGDAINLLKYFMLVVYVCLYLCIELNNFICLCGCLYCVVVLLVVLTIPYTDTDMIQSMCLGYFFLLFIIYCYVIVVFYLIRVCCV